ncbi:MAG: hypothetical protein J7578_12830, partial [Chitinophagaceae bacterium]|nr:hypothetical protein [Chitinophagaceae bacterium]
VVVSDAAAKNSAPGTFVLQNVMETPNDFGDLVRGIVIDMGAAAAVPYMPGDSLVVNIDGAKLEKVNGRLSITGIQAGKITKAGSNAAVIVRSVTLAMIANDFEAYESTVVSVHANVKDHAAGVNYSGQHPLFDNSGVEMTLQTKPEADFASEEVAVNANFTGIVTNEGDKKGIALRSAADIKYKSGALYSGFPESFEFPDFSVKSSYNMTATNNDVDLSTGNWKLLQAILGNTIIRDKFNFPGKQCVRMQQNLSTDGLVQMNFDLTEGASKVTLFYGKYYTDPASTFKLEYSTNGGTSWTQAGADVKDMPVEGSKQATFEVNIAGNVRFRVRKMGLGTSTATKPNGRLCIEDIAIYKAL